MGVTGEAASGSGAAPEPMAAGSPPKASFFWRVGGKITNSEWNDWLDEILFIRCSPLHGKQHWKIAMFSNRWSITQNFLAVFFL